MKEAFLGALKPAIRTFVQTLGGSLGALAVAQLSDFAQLGPLAILLLWGAVIAALIAFCQNFAERIPTE